MHAEENRATLLEMLAHVQGLLVLIQCSSKPIIFIRKFEGVLQFFNHVSSDLSAQHIEPDYARQHNSHLPFSNPSLMEFELNASTQG